MNATRGERTKGKKAKEGREEKRRGGGGGGGGEDSF